MYDEFDEASKLLLTFELDGVTKEQKWVLYRTLGRLMEVAASNRDETMAFKIEDMRARLNALPPAKTAIQHRALQPGNEFDEVSRRLLDFELNGITKEQKEVMRRALQRLYDDAVAVLDGDNGQKIQDMRLRLDALIPKEQARRLDPSQKVAPQEKQFKQLDLSELRGKIDFAIITIREDEYEAVLERFAPEPSYTGHRRYVISRVQLAGSDYCQVAIARSTDPGEGPAQDLARDMIEQLDPKWLLVIGIAGGIPDDDFTLGDVVVAKRLLDFSVKATSENRPPEYDVRGWAHPLVEARCAALPSVRRQLEEKWNRPELIIEPRPPVQLGQDKFYGDEAWKQKVKASLERHFNTPRPPRFTTAAVAATEELVKSPTLVQLWLQDARSMRAVEMELAGVYQAARRMDRQYPVLAIRGISDIVGFKRDPAWTAYACHTAAAFAYALVRSGFIIDRPSQSVVTPSGSLKISLVPKWSGDPIGQWDQPLNDFKTIRLAGKAQLVTLYSDPDVPVPKPLLGQDNVPFWLETGADRVAIFGIDLRSGPPSDRKPSLDITPGTQGANCAYILLTAGNGYRDKSGVKFVGRKIGWLKFYFDTGETKEVGLFLGHNVREWFYNGENVVNEFTDPNMEQVWHPADDRFTLDMLRVDFGGPRNVLKFCVVAECEGLPAEYLDDPPHIRVSGLTYRVATSPSSADETENKQPKPLKPVATLPSSEQLLRLESKIDNLLKELPYIRSLHLDHPDNQRWRTTVELRFQELDQVLPGGKFSQKYPYIAWHRPDKAADDSEEQRALYLRACSSAEGLLTAALQELREKRTEAQMDIPALSTPPSTAGAPAGGGQVNQQATGNYIAQASSGGTATVSVTNVQLQLARTPTAQYRSKLRQNLSENFSDNELRDLCFDMQVDYESLPGEGKSAKARELIAFCERRGRLPELVTKCYELRPNVAWGVE